MIGSAYAGHGIVNQAFEGPVPLRIGVIAGGHSDVISGVVLALEKYPVRVSRRPLLAARVEVLSARIVFESGREHYLGLFEPPENGTLLQYRPQLVGL